MSSRVKVVPSVLAFLFLHSFLMVVLSSRTLDLYDYIYQFELHEQFRSSFCWLSYIPTQLSCGLHGYSVLELYDKIYQFELHEQLKLPLLAFLFLHSFLMIFFSSRTMYMILFISLNCVNNPILRVGFPIPKQLPYGFHGCLLFLYHYWLCLSD